MPSALVDSNILIYYVNLEDEKKHWRVREFLEEKRHSLLISYQNLREVAAVLSQKYAYPENDIIAIIKFFFESLPVAYDNMDDLCQAIKISSGFNIPFWDALLIATAERNNIEIIYTENTADFGRYRKIKAVNPLIPRD